MLREKQITLTTVDGDWHMHAYMDDVNFPGLAVHTSTKTDYWAVTHELSGKTITYPTWGYRTRRQAIVYAQFLATHADWTQDKTAIAKSLDMPFVELVRKAQLQASAAGFEWQNPKYTTERTDTHGQ